MGFCEINHKINGEHNDDSINSVHTYIICVIYMLLALFENKSLTNQNHIYMHWDVLANGVYVSTKYIVFAR